MSQLRVLFFSHLRDAVGESELEIETPTTVEDVTQLLDKLCADYPKLNDARPSIRVAINQEYVELDAPVSDGDEVAIMPPVQGG
ncbi:MAG: molybdopterin converting factor subunit 1 [Verrucomicrobiota bacterium]